MEFDVMLLPEQGECTELFFHTATPDTVQCSDGILHLKRGGALAFDAYYNLFPAMVYRNYTACTSPTLCLHVQGRGNVVLAACDAQGDILAEERAAVAADAPCEMSLQLDVPQDAAAVYWRFSAESDCVLYRGHLRFAEPVQQEVLLAVGICTYRREEFVTRNAERIAACFEKTGNDSHHLFISDNGGTLGGLWQDSPRVTCVQNPNNGGSGGFSRVMQEALRSKTEFTHLLLMDDDIAFRPEILERLVFFLRYCRSEYAHMTVGGAMCLLDEPWHQFEAGAKFLTGGVLQGLQMHLDLRDAKQCIRNAAAVQEADYNSWWCCCMSMEKIRNAGLSMPFFFKMDDVEYALRLGERVVCLPGVCVSHESFVKKYNPALEYYIVRNTLITCALHSRERGTIGRIKQLFSAVLRNVMLQRYDTAELILRAYSDFLKGADFLKDTDASALHKEILQSAPQCEAALPETKPDAPAAVSRLVRMLTLGGILLPCNRDSAVVDAFSAGSSEAFRVRELVHYYPMTGMAYRTKLRRGRALTLSWKAGVTALRFFMSYHRAADRFLTQSGTLSSFDFWNHTNRSQKDE